MSHFMIFFFQEQKMDAFGSLLLFLSQTQREQVSCIVLLDLEKTILKFVSKKN